MCCSFISITCAIQLWCLKKYDSCLLYPLTRFLLSVLYYIDIALYSVNPRAFLVGRSEKLKSQNFASLGRMILGDHPVVSKAINAPQIRDAYLGRARLIPSKVADAFPLFLSDALEEENVKHKAIHDSFWIKHIPVANRFVEKNAEVFQGYVKEIVESEKDGVPDTEIIRKSVIKYIFHSLLGRIDERIVEITYSLFFSTGLGGYINGAIKLPLGCCCLHWKNDRKRSSLIEEAVKYVSESPHMANYKSFQNISKEQYSELLFSVSGIAGCLGTTQLIVNIFNEIPKDFVVDVTDPREVLLCILEAARIRAPVNNVNFRIAEESMKVNYKGKDITLPKGVLCAASMGLASLDPDVFPDPKVFNPKRENLEAALINFNHVGYAPTGSGTRQCPGRNISIKFASSVLIEYQNKKK